MGRVFQPHADVYAHGRLLLIILVIEVDDLDLALVDPNVIRQFFITKRVIDASIAVILTKARRRDVARREI
jgi:hypothetical protein